MLSRASHCRRRFGLLVLPNRNASRDVIDVIDVFFRPSVSLMGHRFVKYV